MRRLKGAAFFDELPPTSRDPAHFIEAELPLVKATGGYWCASGARFDALAHTVKHWNKRIREREMETRTPVKNIEIGKGQFKAYHQPILLTVTGILSWHVLCPDADAVNDLCALLQYVEQDGVGKKAATGYGKIVIDAVTPVEHDESVWGMDGTLRRAVPTAEAFAKEGAGGFTLRDCALTPPYFLPPFVRCAVPILQNAVLQPGSPS